MRGIKGANFVKGGNKEGHAPGSLQEGERDPPEKILEASKKKNCYEKICTSKNAKLLILVYAGHKETSRDALLEFIVSTENPSAWLCF